MLRGTEGVEVGVGPNRRVGGREDIKIGSVVNSDTSNPSSIFSK